MGVEPGNCEEQWAINPCSSHFCVVIRTLEYNADLSPQKAGIFSSQAAWDWPFEPTEVPGATTEQGSNLRYSRLRRRPAFSSDIGS